MASLTAALIPPGTMFSDRLNQVDARIATLRRARDDLARIVGCACDSLDRCTCGAAYLARRGKDSAPASLLHVTNGAGNTLRQTAIGGTVLIRANADDPRMHERYLQYRELLEAEPEWHDGEIIYEHHA